MEFWSQRTCHVGSMVVFLKEFSTSQGNTNLWRIPSIRNYYSQLIS